MLNHQQQQHTGSVRHVAQNELDKAMVEVLQLPDLDVYEKAKKYSAILQRYRSLVKQGMSEKNVLTLSLPSETGQDASDRQSNVGGDRQKDMFADEILSYMAKRSRKNAELILTALTRASGVSWNDRGEIIIDNQIIRGSHLYDLIKSATATRRATDVSWPAGWSTFLKTLARLNVPLSAFPNAEVRRTISQYKGDTGDPSVETNGLHKKRSLSDQSLFTTHKKSRQSRSGWIDF